MRCVICRNLYEATMTAQHCSPHYKLVQQSGKVGSITALGLECLAGNGMSRQIQLDTPDEP